MATTDALTRTGGQILVDELAAHGARHAYCVPGESYLPVLDALHDSTIELTVCRQEGGAAMMADAYGKLTGRPGICFVTRGPGTTNATAGLHIARQDSTPMILFIGQVERAMREREAFQEIDYRAMLGPLTKWTAEIDDPARLPEFVSRAFHLATSGRPGPVALALPEDVLAELAVAPRGRALAVDDAAPSPTGIARLAALLAGAQRPLVILGGSAWDAPSVARLVAFAERASLPVAVSFRRQGLYPAGHPNYVGDIGVAANPALVEYARDADLVLLIGGRLSEMPSQGYTLLSTPFPTQTLVHVHPGSDELARVYRPDLAFCVTPRAFSEALSTLAVSPPPTAAAHVASGRQAYELWSESATEVPGDFNLGAAICALRGELADDAIICNGAGNYAVWVHRYHRYNGFATQLAPTSGSMGYGVPAAVAAKRLYPGRTVVAYAGDGCFLMHGQEFATAVRYGLAIIVIVADNGMYGTIRMHQERHYPGRVIGTQLANPDFAAYARAFGGHGERVTRTAEFLPAFRRALASGLPAILHCLTDPDAITPSRTLGGIRSAALSGDARG
jgi:acetolactate synthase-1/2/3 large subunit